MERQLNVMRQILGLADTMQEGIDHIHERHLSGYGPETTVSLFADVVHAFAEIETVIYQTAPTLKDADELAAQAESLREGFRWMTTAYGGASDMTPMVTLNLTVRPRFRAWHQALREVMRPYVSS